MKKATLLAQHVCTNIWSNLSGCRLTYIVEARDWAIKQVGVSLVHALKSLRLFEARISYTPVGVRNQLIHFGSVNTFFRAGSVVRPHASNKIILTWFHVEPRDDHRLGLLKDAIDRLEKIHTSCQITKHRLIQAGIEPTKIHVIPLGVDLDLFHPVSNEDRVVARQWLGIPDDRFVIGSFQKDGVGWGTGMEPKLVKGPDVFVDVVDRLRDVRPFVLLTGPARGYIKSELEKRHIEYLHVYPKDFRGLSKMYHALDLYLITSRVEGGPLSLLEAWASGIPVVSTRVGMVADIAHDSKTALLAEVDDVDTLVAHAKKVLEDPHLREHMITQALEETKNYSWEEIAHRYVDELYRPFV